MTLQSCCCYPCWKKAPANYRDNLLCPVSLDKQAPKDREVCGALELPQKLMTEEGWPSVHQLACSIGSLQLQ